MDRVSRNYNLDLLRILACFMVVLIHISAINFYDINTNSIDFITHNFFDSTARAAVPLFVMISGVFFLNKDVFDTKKLYLKKIFKLIIFYFCWNAIYYFRDWFFYKQSFDVIDFYNKLVTGHYHLWFIPMIIGLYIISPFLSKITIRGDKKLFKYLILLFSFSCFVHTIDYCEFLPKYDLIHKAIAILPLDIICQYYSYFLLGYFLYNYDFSLLKNKKKLLFLIYGISVISCTILTWYASLVGGQNTANFYNNFSFFTLLEAISLFLLFKYSSFLSEKVYAEKVTFLAKSTLGIYGIHDFIIFLFNYYEIITINDLVALLSIPIMSIMVFIVSLIIVLLLRKIGILSKVVL